VNVGVSLLCAARTKITSSKQKAQSSAEQSEAWVLNPLRSPKEKDRLARSFSFVEYPDENLRKSLADLQEFAPTQQKRYDRWRKFRL